MTLLPNRTGDIRRAAVLALFVAASVWGQAPARYQDPSLPMNKRADDLVSRMKLEEKVSQLMNDSPAIERLGIPAYNWWNECLHGVARAGRATVFPETIGLAATWNDALLLRVSTAISDEARAKYHEFVRRGKRNIYQGLTFWTPNINLFRDPRWGRGMETYGEDPYLTGRMAVAFIKGLQGDDPKYLKTIATAKHYAVHSGPESQRHTFDAVVSEADLRESYLPQFKTAVKEGGAYSVMCSYNRVDGLPACASPRLLEDILRKEWGFAGYVVSDCGAIGDIYLNHKTAPDAVRGVASAVKSGTDLNCGVEYTNLVASVRQGAITESEIDRALARLLLARFRLGLFDPPEMVPFARIPYSENDSPAHRELALQTARESIVLLKNENNTLPLRKNLNTLAVIGPNADDAGLLLGNYNGNATAPVTPLEGIQEKVGPKTRVLYARGSNVAAEMPTLETVPASALRTSNDAGSRPGLVAEYFGTANFDGKQHRPRELTYPNSGQMTGAVPGNPQPLFTETDPAVDFQWWDGAPRAGMNDDDFGVRWTGYLAPDVSGTYQLGGIGLNAFELYFEGRPLVSFNGIHESAYQSAQVQMEAGKLYQIRLDFHHYLNDAEMRLVWSKPAVDLVEPALQAARQADAVVMMLGLSPRLEGEEMRVPVPGFQGGDRVTLDLPAAQEDLLRKVAALNKPVVVVLLNGSAVAVNWAREHVPAIVESWYPGQAGGTALADVLFGDYNPAGRLPVTFYNSAADLPAFTDYSMKGRTYRYFKGEPLFPFGFGLSYTTFAYSNLRLPPSAQSGAGVHVAVDVRNTGTRAGDEVVQLYVKGPSGRPGPIRSLAAFRRISLAAGETKTVEFDLAPSQLGNVGEDGRSRISPGALEISIGGKQPGFRGAADARTTQVVTGSVRVEGPEKVLD